MEKEEVDKWINWLIQGLLLSLCLSLAMYIFGERKSEYLLYDDVAILFLPSIVELIISSWLIIRRSKAPSFICCAIFTLISELLIYMLSDIYWNDSYYSSDYKAVFYYSSLKYLVPLVTIAWMAIKYKQPGIVALFNKDKTQHKAHRAISFMEAQSILRLLFLLQRTSSKSIESEEVNAIIQTYRGELGINYDELEYHIRHDRQFSTEEILHAIKPHFESLRKDFKTHRLSAKCQRIVEISESKEASEIFRQIFPLNSETQELSSEVREAPLKLIALISGASPTSAFSDVTTSIMQKYAEKLNFTREQVSEILTNDMQREPQEVLESINSNLRALSQRFKLNNFKTDCQRIADISSEPIAHAIIQQAFRNI